MSRRKNKQTTYLVAAVESKATTRFVERVVLFLFTWKRSKPFNKFTTFADQNLYYTPHSSSNEPITFCNTGNELSNSSGVPPYVITYAIPSFTVHS